MGFIDFLKMITAVVALSIFIYAVFIEPYKLDIRKIDIHIPELPELFDGLTICHLTDLHIAYYGKMEAGLHEALMNIDADLCVITGDIVRKSAGVQALPSIFEGFNPSLGIYAVLGNGERKLRISKSEMQADLAQWGIQLLCNNHNTIFREGKNLHIIGVDDPYSEVDDLDAAMSGVSRDEFKILLAHSPDILMKIVDHPVNLILAGHTHGGQIRLPFIGPLWLHCRYPLGFSDGYFGPDALISMSGPANPGLHMYISRGLGGSGIRARLLCPPEIALITLRRKFQS